MENLMQKDLFKDYIKELTQCRYCGAINPPEFFAQLEHKEKEETLLTCICKLCAAKQHLLDIHGELKAVANPTCKTVGN